MMKITPFSPAERKALMEELFPLKRTARDYDLRQDMTLDGYIRQSCLPCAAAVGQWDAALGQCALSPTGRPCTKRYYPGGGGAVPRRPSH